MRAARVVRLDGPTAIEIGDLPEPEAEGPFGPQVLVDVHAVERVAACEAYGAASDVAAGAPRPGQVGRAPAVASGAARSSPTCVPETPPLGSAG